MVDNPRYLSKQEEKLRRAQRKLSKKVKGTANSVKQSVKVAKIYKKIQYQRNDFLHKLSSYYVNHYDTIFIEDLKIVNLQKNHHYQINAWISFFKKLEYKAARAGILLRKVAAAGTSQDCSGCGKVVKKSLATRTHRCSNCGLVINRDYNASLVIKQRGMESLPMVYGEIKPAESRPLITAQNG